MDFRLLNKYTSEQVESEVIRVYCYQHAVFVLNPFLENLLIESDSELHNTLLRLNNTWSIKDIELLFESLIDKNYKKTNGIVFTPEYIVNEIIENTLINLHDDSIVLDPACGSGAFLIPAVIYVSKKTGKNPKLVIEDNIYGFDLDDNNVRRTKILMNLLLIDLGIIETEGIKFNIYKVDSLIEDWKKIINDEKIDFIIGNPPYVNSHDLDKAVMFLLKEKYHTMRVGNTNIFYAFIEKSMNHLHDQGELGFVVPNNFLTIKAAANLRNFLVNKRYIKRILNFGSNMVFKPVMTYSCILYLDKKDKNDIQYFTIDKTNEIIIPKMLSDIKKYISIPFDELATDKWKLATEDTRENLKKIESFDLKIGKYIKTGIATLRDKLYILDGYNLKNDKYYKMISDKKYYIESQAVKRLYKVSEINDIKSVEKSVKYIIFPYKFKDGKVVIIEEDELENKYPLLNSYFFAKKEELSQRDKGKKVEGKWYEYGRSQGLNNFGYKIIYPTFSNRPKFIPLMDKEALFVNGYAITCKDEELELFIRVLNSRIMTYYILNTSYSIEGGFMCYQKRYLENFSIPEFSMDELKHLLNLTSQIDIDEFLVKKYKLDL
jgi:type I restriction-modification system DNA methylase subunit